jgi:hypothetical protein
MIQKGKILNIKFSETEQIRITVYLQSGVVSGTAKMSIDDFNQNCKNIRECIDESRYMDICFDLDDGEGGYIRLPFFYLEKNVFHVQKIKKQ